jgi:2,3-bisphosphoglycerate-independent phosphoglycerate mutase
VKYVVCIPDGCADQPLAQLDGATPLQVAHTPVLDKLASVGSLLRARVIPEGLPPGSDVGNMSILGYDPSAFHTGRAPIEAAALGLEVDENSIAFRCNLVTIANGEMSDFAGGHPASDVAAKVIAALDANLGGEVAFHPGMQYRHTMVAPASWLDVDCVPPHDLTDKPVVGPSGSAAGAIGALMEASRDVLADFDIDANQIWLWGQGRTPSMPSFRDQHGLEAGLVSAVDLVKGLGRLTDMDVVDVEGATGWYDTNYEGKRDAAIAGLSEGADLFVIHVEATDEAGHAGDVEAKIEALENWDSRIFADLVDALDEMGDWRMAILPDHATPLALRTHTSDPVPCLMVDSIRAGGGGVYTEAGVESAPLIAGHSVLTELIGSD